MGTNLAIGIGAGLVSALLFVAARVGGPLSIVVFITTPLPILIASLGWNHRVGIVASLAGAALVAVMTAPLAGLYFAVATGLASWWIGYLALLARSDVSGVAEWYPVGRLLSWMAAISGLVTSFALYLIAPSVEAFRTIVGQVARQFTAAFPQVLGQVPAERRQATLDSLTEFMVTMLPAALSTITFLATVLVVWIAGRVVLKSGRLPRPWPDLTELRLPVGAAAALVGLALVSVLGEYIGLMTRGFAAAFAAAFALQGLAVLHSLSRGLAARGPLLFALYVALLFLSVWLLTVLTVLGLVDAFIDIRRRFNSPGPPDRAGPPPAAQPPANDTRSNPWK